MSTHAHSAAPKTRPVSPTSASPSAFADPAPYAGNVVPNASANSERCAALALYRGVRAQSEVLAVPLSAEDQTVQSMPDASPTKWHLAHTSWFFETMVLGALSRDYVSFDPTYAHLFNSYYVTLGSRHPRAQRGLLTRPTCADIAHYRAHVDRHIESFVAAADDAAWQRAAPLLMLGCHHEQQHQELLLMDILHAFSCNPLWPAYRPPNERASGPAPAQEWITCDGGDVEIGYAGADFAFDNEGPVHVVRLAPYRLASRPITNGEWLEFMADGGYRRPELWLSDGWATVQQQAWTAPLYWTRPEGDGWQRFTLGGLVTPEAAAPVCHISYYEAEAFARWAGKRLPTESEWEAAALALPRAGNFLDDVNFEPVPAAGHGLQQMYGDVWEWTASSYSAYPGFKTGPGAVGEYNGKFMINQIVLRGGSCVTPARHIRPTYRNFFYPNMRWQFAGLRLAEDV
jgi:ergothioneine biosynthesis protein EgtB